MLRRRRPPLVEAPVSAEYYIHTLNTPATKLFPLSLSCQGGSPPSLSCQAVQTRVGAKQTSKLPCEPPCIVAAILLSVSAMFTQRAGPLGVAYLSSRRLEQLVYFCNFGAERTF